MKIRKNKNLENVLYLDDSIDNEKSNSRLTLKDSLQDDFNVSDYCELQQEKQQLLKLVVQKLDARQRQVVILRYGLFGNNAKTQQEVSEILGISRSYVSRIEKAALEKLREEIV